MLCEALDRRPRAQPARLKINAESLPRQLHVTGLEPGGAELLTWEMEMRGDGLAERVHFNLYPRAVTRGLVLATQPLPCCCLPPPKESGPEGSICVSPVHRPHHPARARGAPTQQG